MTAVLAMSLLSGIAAPAGDHFRAGVERRGNRAEAEREFRIAADGFDADWRTNSSPGVARNRGHAHFLAGDAPRAVVALRAGLDVFPYDAGLQQSLAAVRAEVGTAGPPREVRHRVSPWDLYFAVAGFGLAAAVGLAARFTARPAWAVPAAGIGGVGLFVVLILQVQMDRERAAAAAEPFAVVAVESPLRTGNAIDYPPRLPAPLPAGAEVAVLGRRGGWVRVRTAAGSVGWVAEIAVLREGEPGA